MPKRLWMESIPIATPPYMPRYGTADGLTLPHFKSSACDMFTVRSYSILYAFGFPRISNVHNAALRLHGLPRRTFVALQRFKQKLPERA